MIRGSAEWRDMIEQELKELTRLIDRKADKQQIARYLVAYVTPTLSTGDRRSVRPNIGYRFGHDLEADFKTLFGAFNRVARRKMDSSTIADFASVSFVDSMYQRQSVEFSAQLGESCSLYYRLFDEKIENLCVRMHDFRRTVTQRLSEMNSRAQKLTVLVRRLIVNNPALAKIDKTHDDDVGPRFALTIPAHRQMAMTALANRSHAVKLSSTSIVS